MRILPVGAELFHANGQTDMTKLSIAFRRFVNAPKKKGNPEINTRISGDL